MKTLAMCLILCAALVALVGCATVYPVGVAYTEVKVPVTATGVVVDSPKVGTAECMSVLSLVALGDASIEAAMKQGGIKKVSHVDWDAKNILGIIGKYKVTVYGD
jgi:hypothetical protein